MAGWVYPLPAGIEGEEDDRGGGGGGGRQWVSGRRDS